MKKELENWEEEFEKRFFIRRKTGLWVNPDTFLIDNVYSFIRQLLKSEKREWQEENFRIRRERDLLLGYKDLVDELSKVIKKEKKPLKKNYEERN